MGAPARKIEVKMQLKGRILLKTSLLAVSLVLLSQFASSLDVSACGDLNSTNTYYKLTQNIEAGYTCFNVTASNITLDCQGFNINYSTSTDGGIGINVTEQNDTVIKNCKLNATNSSVNQPTAIYLRYSNNSQIYNNTITVNSTTDIAVWVEYDSNNNTINNNTIIESYDAFWFRQTMNNTANRNNITSQLSGAFGIYAEATSNSTFENNNISMVDSSYAFMLLNASNYNFLNNNNIYVTDSSYGIYLETANGNTIDNNPVYLTSNGSGIYVSNSNNNMITNSIINASGTNDYGILLSEANYSNISNYVIKGSNVSNGFGITAFYSAFYNLFSNVTIENFTYGVHAAGSLGICDCFNPGPKKPLRNSNENVFDRITINNADYGYYTNNPPSVSCWCPFPPPGHESVRRGYHTYHNTLSNAIITNAIDGISINGSEENTFLNNTITNSSGKAIYMTDYAHAITSSIVKSNTINKANYCIFLDAPGEGIYNNSFYYNRLSSCGYGITLDNNAYDNVFADSAIGQSNNADVYAPSVAVSTFTNTFLNTTFNKTNATINNGGIVVQWYLRTRVMDTSGSGIENAEVNITDVNGTLVYSVSTGADGYTQTQNVSEFWQNATSLANYTPHTVSAMTNPSASATTQMTENREVILTLDYQPPAISNVRIVDVTQNTVTIAWDTSKNANETIEYGTSADYGTNYTNAARATTHSAFITGLNKATTYHYKIHACGTTNCANTSDYTFDTVGETGGYGGGTGAGGGALPTPSPIPTPTEQASPSAPQAPSAGPAGEAGAQGGTTTPEATAQPSLEASPSPTPQPTGAGVNVPLAVGLTIVLAAAAYFIATRARWFQKKK